MGHQTFPPSLGLQEAKRQQGSAAPRGWTSRCCLWLGVSRLPGPGAPPAQALALLLAPAPSGGSGQRPERGGGWGRPRRVGVGVIPDGPDAKSPSGPPLRGEVFCVSAQATPSAALGGRPRRHFLRDPGVLGLLQVQAPPSQWELPWWAPDHAPRRPSPSAPPQPPPSPGPRGALLLGPAVPPPRQLEGPLPGFCCPPRFSAPTPTPMVVERPKGHSWGRGPVCSWDPCPRSLQPADATPAHLPLGRRAWARPRHLACFPCAGGWGGDSS